MRHPLDPGRSPYQGYVASRASIIRTFALDHGKV